MDTLGCQRLVVRLIFIYLFIYFVTEKCCHEHHAAQVMRLLAPSVIKFFIFILFYFIFLRDSFSRKLYLFEKLQY